MGERKKSHLHSKIKAKLELTIQETAKIICAPLPLNFLFYYFLVGEEEQINVFSNEKYVEMTMVKKKEFKLPLYER